MAKPVRPGWLTAIGVIAVVLGVVGILAAVSGVVSQIYSEQMQQWSMQWMRSMSSLGQTGQDLPPEVLQLQEELQRLILDIQRRWRAVLLVLMAINALLSVLLIAGGIGTLRLTSWGRTLLIAAFIATMFYEVAQLVPGLAIQYETTQVTQTFMSRIMAASGAKTGGAVPPAINRTMAVVSNATFALGIAMAVGWGVVKLALYGAAIYYLRTPLIRALFANQRGAAEVQPLGP